MPTSFISLALPGKGAAIFGRKRSATVSKGSPTRHTRGFVPGWTLVKTRMMRWPWLGRDGKASTWSSVSSWRFDCWRPCASTGRNEVLPIFSAAP